MTMAWAADSRWLGLLAEYLIKTTAVLSLALLVAALLRRRSAALRHFVLSAFLVGLVLLPLLPSLPTGWETRWLPARPAVHDAAPAVPSGGATWAGGEPLEVAEPLIIAEPAKAAEPLSSRSATGIPLASRTAVAGIRLRNTEEAPAAGVRAAVIVEKFLPLAWSAGLLVLLLKLGLGLAGAARLSREGSPLDDSVWEALLRRFLAMVALRRRVRLKSHGRVAVPMTWGIVRPVILFPEDSRDWDEGRRSAALFHELSHIKRADFAVMLLVRLSLALFWFNPLVWAVFRRLRREQEKACDELVLKAGIKPSAYARSLLLFRRSAAGAWGPSAALLGMSAGSSLNDRLAAILRQKMTIKEVTMRNRIILTIAILFIVSLIGSARPASPAADISAVAGIAAAPAPAQETAAAAQSQEAQKKQEAEKKKEAEKAAAEKKAGTAKPGVIVLTSREAKPGQVEVIISEGDAVRTIVLDHPIIIEGTEADKAITLKIDGKDLVLKAGEQVRLVARDGKLTYPNTVTYVYPVEAHEHAKGVSAETFSLVEPSDKYRVYYVVKSGEAAPAKEVVVAPPGVPAAPAPPGAPAPPAKITTYDVVNDGKTYTVVLSPRQPHPPYPPAVTYSVMPAYGSALSRKEIRHQLQEIQEQLNQIKERRPDVSKDLKGVEESLKALTEKLEQAAARVDAYTVTARVPDEHITVGVPAEHITVIGKDGTLGETYGVAYSDKGEKAHVITVARGEEEGIAIIYRTGEALKDEAAVARAVDKVKKALPQGYTVEPKADKESGTLTLKIKAHDGQKVDEGLARKIVSILVEELKKDTAGKD